MSGGERGGKLRKTGCWFGGILGEILLDCLEGYIRNGILRI